MKKFSIILLSLIVVALLSTITILALENPSATSGIPSDPRMLSRNDFVVAAEQTVNGVVSIKSYATPKQRIQNQIPSDPFFEFLFGIPSQRSTPQQEPQERQIGLGSGVILSEDGYIVTNNHVIEDAERLSITLNDNRVFDATIIGADPTTDLALIKIDADNLHCISMGNSDSLHVGEWVLAVGNPFGFTSTVTAGIVSAKARSISSAIGAGATQGIESYIQTDAAVNPGNSGGALVNLDGELVGINTAIYNTQGSQGGYIGMSFAIPTSIVEKVVADLKEYGTVQRAVLGLSYVELTPELAKEKNIKAPNAGIYVAEVNERSAAMEAGIEPGDIITAIQGHPTRSAAELQEIMALQSPGSNVEITYYRDGKEHKTKATLRNYRGQTSTITANDKSSLGATFAEVESDVAQKLHIRGGVVVVNVEDDSAFAKAGVNEGFIILAVNGTRVTTPDELKAIYQAILQGNADKVLFLSGIYPSGKNAYYAVPLDN